MSRSSLMVIDRLLVVREPRPSLLVDDAKTWEERKKATGIRGPIGIAASVSSQVIGAADLIDCHGPSSPASWLIQFHRHRAPAEFLAEHGAGGGLWAWELAVAQPFDPPVRFQHPQGAVVWVRLGPPATCQP